ncbi:MAG: hypothetical protein DCC67_02905 [Planctomycetota bacterium]|nr:MAG: hypothetical protein DCC67_02905 [Planctomycetota bacterium]
MGAGIPALLLAWIWLFPDRRPTPLLVVAVSDYGAPLPPNALAAEDAANFQRVLGDYDNIRLAESAAPRNSAALLEAVEGFFNRVTPGGPAKDVALIYCSAHGVVNDQGAPCLLLPEHDPLDAASWLPVAELLAAIDQAAAARDCRAVVMLDSQRIDQHWRLGVAVNTFSLALEELLAESPRRRCAVLAAASGLETAAAAPEIGATTFGHFVLRGLRGQADREGDADGVVTLAELERYVAGHVDAWSARYRGVRQRPKLLGGDAGELRLADVAGTAEVRTQTWTPPVDRNAFRRLFEQVGGLERAQAFVARPMEWAKITYLVERLDAEAFAGSAYASMARATLTELNATIAELAAAQEGGYGFEAPSLAMYRRTRGAPPLAGLNEAWAAWLQDPNAKPAADYAAAAEFVWRQSIAGEAPIPLESIDKGLQFCRLAGQPPDDDFTELGLLRLLRAGVDWGSAPLADGAPRALLAARHQAEELAACEDPRQHYLLGGRIRELDAAWNAALDGVLIGDDDSLHRASERLTTLTSEGPQGYRQLRSDAELALRALRARDAALAAALEFNQFSLRRSRWSLPQRADHGQIDSLVDDALELSRLLDDAMASDPAAPPLTSDRLATLVDRLEACLGGLRANYSQRVAAVAVEEAGSQAQTANEGPQLLRCLVGFDEARTRLHDLWSAKLTSPAPAVAPAAAPPPSGDDLAYLRWCATAGIAPWQRLLADDRYGSALAANDAAPATPVIGEDSPQEEVLRAIAALGARMRHALRQAPAACQQSIDQSTSMLATEPARVARGGYSQADVTSRLLAPLAAGALRFAAGETPPELLKKLDVQAWLAWHGHRVLDDCWGTLAVEPPARGPYFEAAAGIADDVERLNPEASQEATRLRNRLQALRVLMEEWDPLVVQDLFVAGEPGSLVKQRIEFRGEPKLQSGEAALFLTDDDGKLFETYSPTSLAVRRTGVDARQDADLSAQLQPEAIGDVPLLYANALFRGHVQQKVFSIGRGVVVDWQRPAAAEATVVVRGDSKQVSQIVFVVDCSASMQEGNWNKLQQGVEALGLILDKLVQRGDSYRVAVVFYGRRAGWKSASSSEVKRNPAAPWNGQPGNDVEPAFPLTPLNRRVCEDVKALLGKARPWGETPLYLALVRAVDEFDFGAEGPCHLIALTDGVNDVARDQPISPDERKTHVDVSNKLASVRPRVKLDIIEFGGKAVKPQENRKRDTGLAELRAIVEGATPRGSFEPVADAASLAEKLENSLRLDRYRVQAADGTPAAGGESPWRELGEETRLGPLEAATPFTVTLRTHTDATAAIEVEGGEAVSLVYERPPANRLLFPVYEADDQRGPLQPVAGRLVASHMPKLQLADPVFRASIQSGDERLFSRRPDVVWARIQSAEQGDPRAYYFFDPQYEAGHPVPMLALRARGWTGGKFARVELCFAMDAGRLPAEWTPIPPAGSASLEVHGATLQVRSEVAASGVQFVVDEQHQGDGQHYPLHIQLAPMPDSIGRTFFDSNRTARHVFRYSAQPADLKLRALTRRQIEAAGGAVVFERVELPRR